MNENKTKLSVLMTSYNHSRFIRESIDAVLHQTYQDFELIIWDDASADDSWEIIKSYTDQRIHAVRNETNQHYVSNINYAVSNMVKGEYISMPSSDDIFEPEILQRQIDFLDSHPECAAVFTNAKIIQDDGQPLLDETNFYFNIFNQPERNRYEWLNYFFYKGNALCAPSVLFRSKYLKECGPFKYGLSLLDDLDMWIRLCLKFEIHVIPEKLIRYRVHANEANASGNRPDTRIRGQFELFQILNNYRSIDSPEDFQKVFPNTIKYFTASGFELSYALAMAALEDDTYNVVKLYGLQLLFEALNDPARAEKIKNLYNFRNIDFTKLTGKYDVFSIEKEILQNAEVSTQADFAKVPESLANSNPRNEHQSINLLQRLKTYLLPNPSRRYFVVRKLISLITFFGHPGLSLQIAQDLSLIQESLLFDPVWYLTKYQDISQSGNNPAEHYLLYGGYEGRDPSPYFSSKDYLEAYPDVKKAGANPLVHYLRFGRDEGRYRGGSEEFTGSFEAKGNIKNTKNKTLKSRFLRFLVSGLTIIKNNWGLGLRQKISQKTRKPDDESLANTREMHPQVSIVIPVFNALSMTKDCLASLYRETNYKNIEIIILDNASSDGTSQWVKTQLNEHANLKYHRLEQNIGFGPAVNRGIEITTSEYIVILNNDTIVAPGWLNNLLLVMNDDPSIGIVSPLTNYVGEGPQIEPRAQNLKPIPTEIAQFANEIATRTDRIYEPNRLVFFCVLLKREMVDLIGHLDEGYKKGNFEDDDYCMRARMAGFKLAIACNAFVFHHGSATFKKNNISHDNWMGINRERFYRKAGRLAVSYHPPLNSTKNRDISVIVRTKNRPILLRNALLSLANQTFPDFEVVLVNDGGEDVSKLVETFSKHFPIEYINHKESRGRTAAINDGIGSAIGKWISYLDDDDILYPWHFESLIQKAQASSAEVVYSDYNRVLFNDSSAVCPDIVIGASPWEFNRRDMDVQNYIPIHSYIYLHKLIDEVGLWNETYDRLEDYEFLLRLSARHQFQHLKKVTCEYRYYLNYESSVTLGRDGYLQALKSIYQNYPVSDKFVTHYRVKTIHELSEQSKKINELLMNEGTSLEEKKRNRNEIIRLIWGIY